MKNIAGSQTLNQTQDLSLLQKNLSILNMNIHLLLYHKVINNLDLRYFVHKRTQTYTKRTFSFVRINHWLSPLFTIKTDKIKRHFNQFYFLIMKIRIEFHFELLSFPGKNIFQAVISLMTPLVELMMICLLILVSTSDSHHLFLGTFTILQNSCYVIIPKKQYKLS